MDERSRKLLSKDALPNASLPERRPHVKREFRLPGGVAGEPPDLSSLRSRALGAMAAATNGTPMPPPLDTSALGSAPNISVPPTPPPAAIKAAPVAPPKAKGKKGKTPKPVAAKAQPTPPPPVALQKPAAGVAERLWPAIGTPVPPPASKVEARPESARPEPKKEIDPSMRTPAPLPPPPVVIKPEPAGLTPAPLLIQAKTEQFREATSMWFQRGDEEAERLRLQAERDAAEDQAERDGALATRGRWHALAAAAAGGVAAVALIIHFVA